MIKDLTGRRFSRLVVSHLMGVITEKARWYCLCDCGKTKVIASGSLLTGNTRSCGCMQKEAAQNNTKHGAARAKRATTEYATWKCMKQRVLNPNAPNYERYGGRGIKICDRWVNSFPAFIADMGTKPSRSHTIDRIDVNGNYEPSNCRWATKSEQQYNRRDRRKLCA